MKQYQYTKSTDPARDRDRAARRSTRRCEFVPQYTGAYAVVRHEECRHDGVQQYYSTWVLFPCAIEIAQHERVHAGTISYHNILGRTPPYNTIGCRHDGVQQYKYTKSIVPVRDRTA